MAGKAYFLCLDWMILKFIFFYYKYMIDFSFLKLKLKNINRNLDSLTQVEFLYESCCALLEEKILFPDILLSG